MKAILLCLLFVAFSLSVFALGSNAYTAVFSMDTVDPEITIQSPNGGEEWYLGDTRDVVWSITETNMSPNSTNIWYNHGAADIVIAEGIQNTGSHAWILPSELGNNFRVKVGATDSFGNTAFVSSAANFTITYVPPAQPEGVSVSISNARDAVISWQPVSETIYGSPIVPDGYILLYNESPYENDEHYYYYLWDVTDATSFIHSGVARRRDQMYYRVVAYKDIEGRMSDILSEAKTNPERKLSFKEIRSRMNGGHNHE